MDTWHLRKTQFWEEAPFFRLLLPLILAIAIYDGTLVKQLSLPLLTTITLLLLVAFIVVSFIRQTSTLLQALRFATSQCLLFYFGLIICHTNDITHSNNWFGNNITGSTYYHAVVTETPVEKAKTFKLVVTVKQSFQSNQFQPVTGKAIVYIYKYGSKLNLHEGDEILLPAKWQRIKNAGNPFEFDYANYCARNNIYYTQFISPKDYVVTSFKTPLSVIRQCHYWCMAQLDTYITDRATRGLMQAMVVGDDINMDADLRQAYVDTGIIHVVAISGSHVTTFFLMISALFFWIKNKKLNWIKYSFAIAFVWFYVLMAGAPPSAVRAAIMFSILGYGIIFNKTGGALNQLFATAFVLLCAQPMWLYAVGFQLSFVAVLSLIIFYKPIYNLWPQTNWLTKGLWGAIAASLSAELLVSPMVIYYFHLFPITFLIANVVAWVLMSFLLFAGTAIILFSWLPPLASAIAYVTTILTKWFNMVIVWLQGFNPMAFRFLQISFVEMLLVYTVIIFCAIAMLQKNSKSMLVALIITCTLTGFFCVDEWREQKQKKLAIFNSKGQNKIEYIKGKKHYSYQKDDYNEYAVKAAYTGWQAWREETVPPEKCLLINNQKILVLDGENISGSYPVDMVVLRRPLKDYFFQTIQTQFSPKTIVACGNQSKAYTNKWKDSCASNNIQLHLPKTDGAMVIE
jgi:competence protein ComEC